MVGKNGDILLLITKIIFAETTVHTVKGKSTLNNVTEQFALTRRGKYT